MAYKKPQMVAKSSAKKSYVAGCPTKGTIIFGVTDNKSNSCELKKNWSHCFFIIVSKGYEYIREISSLLEILSSCCLQPSLCGLECFGFHIPRTASLRGFLRFMWKVLLVYHELCYGNLRMFMENSENRCYGVISRNVATIVESVRAVRPVIEMTCRIPL